jgi:hypothetical protein
METQTSFLSYARADSEFALKLANTLRDAHANIWIDQLDIRPGSRWDVAIEKALKDANNLIVILSRSAISSNNVMDEVSYALEEDKTIFPVLFEKCDVPFRLRRLQSIDFTADYEKGLEKLLTVLGIGELELSKVPELTTIDKADIQALPELPTIDRADIQALGQGSGALTGDFPSRWHWISDRRSAENSEISILAIIETIIAGGLAISFYLWTNALWHIGVAACLSPFLLLRTLRSTELTLRTAETAYSSYITNIPYIKVMLSPLIVGVIRFSSILV